MLAQKCLSRHAELTFFDSLMKMLFILTGRNHIKPIGNAELDVILKSCKVSHCRHLDGETQTNANVTFIVALPSLEMAFL